MKATNELEIEEPTQDGAGLEGFYIQQMKQFAGQKPLVHFHQPSARPVELIESLPRRENQHPNMRKYRDGYEFYLAMLPRMDRPGVLQGAVTHFVMEQLSEKLMKNKPEWLGREVKHFERSILAVEEPYDGHEGAEILVAHWPTGFTSPVHGHAAGYIYEKVLTGHILVDLYRHVGERKVRPLRSTIQKYPDVLASEFAICEPEERIALPHSFTALTPVDTIHFLPEHTRDSRDNTVQIEYFEPDVQDGGVRLNVAQAMKLPVGSVALVRSKRVAALGDHWIIITGGLEHKEIFTGHDSVANSYRPADVHWSAPNMTKVLDSYEPDGSGLILIKLMDPRRFHEFHGITVSNGHVHFPTA